MVHRVTEKIVYAGGSDYALYVYFGSLNANPVAELAHHVPFSPWPKKIENN